VGREVGCGSVLGNCVFESLDWRMRRHDGLHRGIYFGCHLEKAELGDVLQIRFANERARIMSYDLLRRGCRWAEIGEFKSFLIGGKLC
jgi:hypothetical protein